MTDLTSADKQIRECIDRRQSFAVVAGAGSGKTSSLAKALKYIDANLGTGFKRKNQKVVCITYTKRAREELKLRLDDETLFQVSTIHSFLWNEVCRFTQDIANLITEYAISKRMEKCRSALNGSEDKATTAREELEKLNEVLKVIPKIRKFEYDDSSYSDFLEGKIGHNDVIDIATELIRIRPVLQNIMGTKYPYIFVDEAQDTAPSVINALNTIANKTESLCVGYFGDPMQQIYDTGTGEILGPENYTIIKKCENFRSAQQIVNLANSLRDDLKQTSAGGASQIRGEVKLNLVQAEVPRGNRKRYTDAQLDWAVKAYDTVLEKINWTNGENSKCLFLSRQMIARRLNFTNLHRLFNGEIASQKDKNNFESGSHFLLRPAIQVIWPIVSALESGNEHEALRVLRTYSPVFYVGLPDDQRSLKEVLALARRHLNELRGLWRAGSIKEVLRYAHNNGLCRKNAVLEAHLNGEKIQDVYSDTSDHLERLNMLTEKFFQLNTSEIQAYAEFIKDKSPFSTQHGVKGEEYDNVLVFFDDVEAAWTRYSFSKLFLPNLSGKGTDGQIQRSRRLAYVCFTRARRELQIVLFCLKPVEAMEEVVSNGLFEEEQVRIIETGTARKPLTL